MKKGFTLIELLAVIVILAIIALIATPIILGIINDARKESNERSVDLYASAVKNAIAAYQLTGTSAPTDFSQLKIDEKYVDGDVECATEKLYKDGSFYITGCTVNGDAVEYTYGKIKYEPQYYYFGFDWNGTVGSTEAPATPSTVPPTGKNYYLGYDVTNGVVSTAYVCFVRNNTEYCLKGKDKEAFPTNNTVLEEAFGASDCNPDGELTLCYSNDFDASADSNGAVDVSDAYAACYVSGNGSFGCNE